MEQMEVFKIAVDLDGTLAHYTDWIGPEHIGEPNLSVINLLRHLREYGWEIIVFTCRMNGAWPDEDYEAQYEIIKNWLDENEVPYDKIAKQEDGKIFAHIYLDDARARERRRRTRYRVPRLPNPRGPRPSFSYKSE